MNIEKLRAEFNKKHKDLFAAYEDTVEDAYTTSIYFETFIEWLKAYVKEKK